MHQIRTAAATGCVKLFRIISLTWSEGGHLAKAPARFSQMNASVARVTGAAFTCPAPDRDSTVSGACIGGNAL